MQDWDTRIKNLKTDIQVAREKYVVPFLNAKPKTPPAPKEVTQTLNPAISAMASNQEAVGEKIYENKDPVSSLDLIDKTNNAEQSQNVGLTEEITNKIDNALEKSLILLSGCFKTNNANLWPFIHLSVLAPIVFAFWLLRQPHDTIDAPVQKEALT